MPPAAHSPIFATVVGLAVMGFNPPIANAQWTFTNLHPAGMQFSRAASANQDEQGGEVSLNQLTYPALWSGTAGSWVNLRPEGGATVLGVGGGKQVGNLAPGVTHAVLWQGTAASFVDLNPSGATSSVARATDGVQIGGYAQFGNFSHAGIWLDSAASWTDLNPAGALNSVIYAVGDGTQGGYSTVSGGLAHACFWTGTSASWMSLHPTNALVSAVNAVAPGYQAGVVNVLPNNNRHAGLWRGTAASWVDLNPIGSTESAVNAADGNRQVGYVTLNGLSRASIWTGTEASRVDLQTFVPAGFSSVATGISSDATHVFVVGNINFTSGAGSRAVLWTLLVCCPADFNCSGGPAPLSVQDIFDFLNAWFGGDPRADFNGNGLSVTDIFDFLNAWFAGC